MDVLRGKRRQQRGDRALPFLALVFVDQRRPVFGKRQVVGAQAFRQRLQRLRQFEPELLASELLHQRRFLFDQQQLAAVDDAHPVGDFFRLLDIVGGQDDGDAACAQLLDKLPHLPAQVDVDTGGRLVEEKNFRLMGERLGDHHPPLHAARKLAQHAVLLAPQRQFLEDALDKRRIRLFAVDAAGKVHRVPDRLEHVGRQFLRHQPDLRTRLAEVPDDVVAADQHLAGRRIDETADDRDQRRLAGAVRAEKREDLAFLDLQVDALQRLEPVPADGRRGPYARGTGATGPRWRRYAGSLSGAAKRKSTAQIRRRRIPNLVCRAAGIRLPGRA
jgi:hypothetical protein